MRYALTRTIFHATYLPYTHMHYLDEVPEHKGLITVANDVKKGSRIIERQAQQRYDRINGRHINDAHCNKKKSKKAHSQVSVPGGVSRVPKKKGKNKKRAAEERRMSN